MSKKLSKEAFVQGLAGGGHAEIIYIASAPALALLIVQLISYTKNVRKIRTDFPLQYLMFIVPLVVQMMGPLSPATVFGLLLATATLMVALNLPLLRRERSKVPILALRQALSAHRGSVMLITCIAILAVDFHAFPRRFAKAETYGTGLMDAGVGSIIAASAFAGGMKDAATATAARTRSSNGRTRRDVVRLVALVALGVGRAFVTAVINYQHHVGEYGVHWNFFITLAAVRALTLFIPRSAAGSPLTSAVLGLGVLLGHQGSLSQYGMSAYVHAEERGADFISANKEGILSLPGYFALHLLGCACGSMLEESAGPSSTLRRGQRRRVAAIVGILWAAFFAVSRFIEPVSRRACNASYILWILALNAQSLAMLATATAALPQQPLPQLLQMVNDTMLPTFLVANVLTGVVNLAIDTLNVGDWVARLIVLLYMVFLLVAAAVGQRLMGRDEQRPTLRRR